MGMKAYLSEDEIRIYDAYSIRHSIKEIDGRYFDSSDKAWCVPVNEENINLLRFLNVELDDELSKIAKAHNQNKKPLDIKDKMPIKVKLYKHQEQGFKECLANDGYGLLYEVGLGKTLTAAAVAGARFNRSEVKKLLIVCPLAVLPVWEKEMKSLTVKNTVHLLEGTKNKRLDLLRHFPENGLSVAVINYEGTRILEDDLIKWKPDMLILDESQKIKNPRSKQTKAVIKIAEKTKYKIILTATPIGNNASDVFSQWRVIDESIFGKSFYSFRAKYMVMGGFQGREVVGYKNMKEFMKKMHSKALRIRKEDALDLSKQVFETKYCELEPKAKSIYQALKRDCTLKLENGEITATNILTQMLRLQQCSDGFLRADDSDTYEKVSEAKLKLLKETVIDILSGNEKIVVFARFTKEIEAINKILKALKVEHLTLDGRTKNKGEVVKEFQEKENIKVLVCQTQVGGVGITLTSASVMIFYSLTFSFIDYMQAIGRIHRINQNHRCLYINLVARNTVDEHIVKAIEEKKSLSDNVVNNWHKIIEE